MIQPYVFVFTAVVVKDIDVPEGMDTNSMAFEELISRAAENMDVNDDAELEEVFPQSEIESGLETDPFLLS